MPKPIIARWSDWAGKSSEHLVLRQDHGSVIAEAITVSDSSEPYGARYRILCDPSWRVRKLEIDLVGEERRLRLAADGEGSWIDDGGRPLPNLDTAIDVDLSISPFTNTLPIRRLGLRQGQSSAIRTVYIRIPELSVTTDPQRYTCLDEGKLYRYESLDSDFVRDIEIDENGLVLIYPGLFRRVL